MRLVRAEEARRNPDNYFEGYPYLEIRGEAALGSGYVTLSADDLERLPEYSSSIPTGVCEGKVWKRQVGADWYLGSYEPCDPPEPDAVMTVFRRIEILTPRQAQVAKILTEMPA